MQFLIIFGIILTTFAISFVLINLRQVVTGQEFRGTCASNNPMLKNKVGECSVCGKRPDEECKMPEIKE